MISSLLCAASLLAWPEPTAEMKPWVYNWWMGSAVDKAGIEFQCKELKEKGVWVFGTAAEGSVPMYKADLTGPAAIVIGNEGDGMSQLVRKNCDVMVHIPMKGKITSLNASAAASILLYEAVRQRLN